MNEICPLCYCYFRFAFNLWIDISKQKLQLYRIEYKINSFRKKERKIKHRGEKCLQDNKMRCADTINTNKKNNKNQENEKKNTFFKINIGHWIELKSCYHVCITSILGKRKETNLLRNAIVLFLSLYRIWYTYKNTCCFSNTNNAALFFILLLPTIMINYGMQCFRKQLNTL